MSSLVAILAAGRGSRFGGGKLDAPCAGRPLGRWVLDAVAAAGHPPGLIVVGPDAPAFTGDAMADGWAILTNTRPEEGMGGSVALAARHADGLRAQALLLLLADMPLIGAERIATLAAHPPLTRPVATRYPSGKPGVPARFPASMLADLAALDGDRGAASLLRDRPDVRLLDAPADALTDVDDADSLRRAERLLLSPGRR
ncbi:NTP transferase domain-containing protein [Sphingobium sufflavum]|uniref:nucleotidyltransferase family protein n=1 Tax=Sphingobium sufflavum TaxID=1129547 RepID=UPI001F20AE47|nr:NTP transferase domain-containing protein [Sphingobium sufflavum]MCE7795570.1 NTP transferase domain-containing protein [Sphingobium sufflavum]